MNQPHKMKVMTKQQVQKYVIYLKYLQKENPTAYRIKMDSVLSKKISNFVFNNTDKSQWLAKYFQQMVITNVNFKSMIKQLESSANIKLQNVKQKIQNVQRIQLLAQQKDSILNKSTVNGFNMKNSLNWRMYIHESDFRYKNIDRNQQRYDSNQQKYDSNQQRYKISGKISKNHIKQRSYLKQNNKKQIFKKQSHSFSQQILQKQQLYYQQQINEQQSEQIRDKNDILVNEKQIQIKQNVRNQNVRVSEEKQKLILGELDDTKDFNNSNQIYQSIYMSFILPQQFQKPQKYYQNSFKKEEMREVKEGQQFFIDNQKISQQQHYKKNVKKYITYLVKIPFKIKINKYQQDYQGQKNQEIKQDYLTQTKSKKKQRDEQVKITYQLEIPINLVIKHKKHEKK